MVTTHEVDTFCASFAPWGYRDIEAAIDVYKKAGKNEADLAEAVKDFSDQTDISLEDIDVCYVAYDTLHQEARSDIEAATGKDISNDAPYYGVNVSGNYMCTTFDGKEENMKALAELIETMKERSKVVQWLYDKIKIA